MKKAILLCMLIISLFGCVQVSETSEERSIEKQIVDQFFKDFKNMEFEKMTEYFELDDIYRLNGYIYLDSRIGEAYLEDIGKCMTSISMLTGLCDEDFFMQDISYDDQQLKTEKLFYQKLFKNYSIKEFDKKDLKILISVEIIDVDDYINGFSEDMIYEYYESILDGKYYDQVNPICVDLYTNVRKKINNVNYTYGDIEMQLIEQQGTYKIKEIKIEY